MELETLFLLTIEEEREDEVRPASIPISQTAYIDHIDIFTYSINKLLHCFLVV